MKEITPLSVAWDAWLAKGAGAAAIWERQQKRLFELVAYARQHSRYYAEKYRDVATHIDAVR